MDAFAHLSAGNYAEAIREYQAILELNPNSGNAHYNLHLAYRDTNQLQFAFQELEVAARLLPGYSDIYASRTYLYDVLALKENAPLLQELISRLSDNAKDRQVLLGLRASQREDYPRALTHFENALREQPDAPYIQGYIGRTLIYLGRNAEAREALNAIVSDERIRSTELYNLAIAERNLRNYAAAVPALERAVQLDENYYKAWTMLASTEWVLGHWRSAWRYFRQAVKYSPEMKARRSRMTTS